jgi:hypothetical protein
MDWCRDKFGVGRTHPVAKDTDGPLGMAGQHIVSFLDLPAYANLTTDFLCDKFNPANPDDPTVDYFSYGARYPISLLSPLRLPYEICQRYGDNDGLVPVSSAKWGRYLGTVEADHWDLVNTWGLMGKLVKTTTRSATFNPRDFYLALATKLYQEGH